MTAATVRAWINHAGGTDPAQREPVLTILGIGLPLPARLERAVVDIPVSALLGLAQRGKTPEQLARHDLDSADAIPFLGHIAGMRRSRAQPRPLAAP